jgi:hypothetical protein
LLADGARAEPKRRTTAMALSGIGVGVSTGLIVAGLALRPERDVFYAPLMYPGIATSLVTPSLGQWYANDWLTPGMAVRAGAAAFAVIAFTTQRETITCSDATMTGQTCRELTGTGVALLFLAAIAYTGGSAYDVRDAPDAVDRYNRTQGVFVTPTALRDVRGTPITGAAIGWRF